MCSVDVPLGMHMYDKNPKWLHIQLFLQISSYGVQTFHRSRDPRDPNLDFVDLVLSVPAARDSCKGSYLKKGEEEKLENTSK